MAKNILIYSDGTGQAGGLRPDQRLSNIYKLYRATRVGPDSPIDPDAQLAFYDAGLGTAPTSDPAWVRPFTALRKIFASATGSGISRNIADCYEAILERYEPGDRIYLFGFSRGGYTARCLANTIALCGLPTQGANGEPLPRKGRALRAIADEAVHKVYDHATGRLGKKHQAEREELARRFRARYGSEDPQRPGKANAALYFIGVFDSVAAVGLRPWMRVAAILAAAAVFWGLAFLAASLLHAILGWDHRMTAYSIFALSGAAILVKTVRSQYKYITGFEGRRIRGHFAFPRFSRKDDDTYLDPDVKFARHALAIDERRYDFGRAKWGSAVNTDTKGDHPVIPRMVQMWFAGNHSDIGGSYPEEESRLSDIPLKWMADTVEALPHPVIIDWNKLNLSPRASGMQHCEVESSRELYPAWWPRGWRWSWKLDHRFTASGAQHHPSVKERLDAPAIQNLDRREPYRPLALIYHRPCHGVCQEAHAGRLPGDFEARWAVIQSKWAREDAKAAAETVSTEPIDAVEIGRLL